MGSSEWRERLALSALVFGVAAPIAYLLQRLIDYALGVATDPVALLDTPHVAYYWRCALGIWWGGLAALVAWQLSKHVDARRWPSRLAYLSLPVCVLFVLLTWWFP